MTPTACRRRSAPSTKRSRAWTRCCAGRRPPTTPSPPPAGQHLLPTRMPKLTLPLAGHTAIAYWGGTLQVVDGSGKTTIEQQLPQDITALAVMEGKLIAGLANGQVVALETK